MYQKSLLKRITKSDNLKIEPRVQCFYFDFNLKMTFEIYSAKLTSIDFLLPPSLISSPCGNWECGFGFPEFAKGWFYEF